MAVLDFNTPNRIIRMAMQDAGLLGQGQNPTPEQFAGHMHRLNDMVNLWQTTGLKLWLNSKLSVVLTAGLKNYSLAGQPKRVLEAYYQNNAITPSTRPLNPMSWNTYNTLANLTQQGPVNSYFVDKQLAATVLSLWLVPDSQAALGTVQAIVQNPVHNVVTLTEDMGFPNEWYIALHWGLSAEICTGQPEPIVQRCERRAAAYLKTLEDWDVEDAPVTFQPNSQNMRPSEFR